MSTTKRARRLLRKPKRKAVEGSADPHSQAEQGRVAYAFPSAPRWAWRELQDFIEYKAEAAGIQVIYINPAYSSKTCSICGCIGVRQKHTFSCSSCGHLAHSDHNAAVNLAKLAEAKIQQINTL